jgi:hypothetical protein
MPENRQEKGGPMANEDIPPVTGRVQGPTEEMIAAVSASLTPEETALLSKLDSKLKSMSEPEVVAHSQQWTEPEANTADGLDAITMCACGIWSGSGASL